MQTEQRGPTLPSCLVLAHGAGSSADFLMRAFPAAACATDTDYLQDRTGSVARIANLIIDVALARRDEYRRIYVGGVSLGAHAAALAAAALPHAVAGCVLALPAWTGPPPEANPTRAAAEEVARDGADAVLARLRADPRYAEDWVVQELQRAWPKRPTLAEELGTAAGSPAPSTDVLRLIVQPTLVLALDEDPFHPLAVARSWAECIPNADLRVIPRHLPARDRSVFGGAVGRWLGAQKRD
jgi:pimeloyl-ACP methyl ester carboxylesterase